MTKIKIVTDSTVDLPQQFFTEHGITVLPMMISFGEETYLDGVDITPEEFYAKLTSYDGFPTTAQISPGVFMKTYEKLAPEADIILSIHLSGKLSGTLDSAKMAAQQVEGANIIVYDSESASLGGGILVMEAVRGIEEGLGIDEIIQRLDRAKETISIYFSVPGLEHLHKGGRIGKASVLLGGLLNIVPLLTVDNGSVAPFEKLRGKKRVQARLLELLGDALSQWGKDNTSVYVLHTVNLEGAMELAEKIKADYDIAEVPISQLGPAIGVHTGPGVIAIVFYKKVC